MVAPSKEGAAAAGAKNSPIPTGSKESLESSGKGRGSKEWTARNLYNGTDVSVSKDKRISKDFNKRSMFKSKQERDKQL